MIDELPDAPDPANDIPAVFNQKAAALVLAQKAMVPQINAAIASIGNLAAGNANKIPYKIDLGTAMSDPGAGWLRLNNAAQNTATAMVVDLVGSDTIDYTNLLGTFSASTSTSLGTLRVEKQGDATKFLIFALTSVTSPTGYRQFTVACVGYSSANPFAQGDLVNLLFNRTGDKGDIGSGSLVLLTTDVISSAVASLDRLNVFTSAYDKYFIEIEGMTASNAAALNFWFAKGGTTVDTSTSYTGMVGDSGTLPAATSAFSPGSIPVSGTVNALTATLKVRNANATATSKGLGMEGASSAGSTVREGLYFGQNAVTGFRLAASGGFNLVTGIVRVFGVKNT